jgi:hypothetical protein
MKAVLMFGLAAALVDAAEVPSAGVLSERGGSSGTTELFYDFSDPSQLQDFEDATGNWQVKDGALVGFWRGESSIRLRKILEGEISVSWEHSLDKSSQQLGGDDVSCGLEIGDPGVSRSYFWNGYRVMDVFRAGGAFSKSKLPHSNLPAGCYLRVASRDSTTGRLVVSLVNPSTKIRGQTIQMGQPRAFQLDLECRQAGVELQQSEAHVQLQGCGWKMEDKRILEFKPHHYVRLICRNCTVRFRNLRIRFGKPKVASPVASSPAPSPVTPPASAPSSPLTGPLSAAESRAAARLVNDFRNGLVFFAGPAGQGSGFITNYKGQKFLLSNAHVIAGIKGAVFKLLDGTPVTVGAGSVAVGHDIVALNVTSGGTAIPMVETPDSQIAIGDPVVVLGNAEGAEVINPLEGRVVGIGVDRIEIDAPFQKGNSGSPIIHLPTGKVIGIATYYIEKRTNKLEIKYREGAVTIAPEVTFRRFGYRLDSVQQWQPIDWGRFYAEADTMKKIEETTETLWGFLKQFRDAYGNTKNTAMPPAIGSILDRFRRSSHSQADVERLLLDLCPMHASEMSQGARFTYGYFKDEFAKQKKERSDIGDLFRKRLTR